MEQPPLIKCANEGCYALPQHSTIDGFFCYQHAIGWLVSKMNYLVGTGYAPPNPLPPEPSPLVSDLDSDLPIAH